MKRYILYVTAIVALACVNACTPEVEIPLEADVDTIQIGPEGGIRKFQLSVSEDWEVMTNEPWVSFSPANGKGSEVCEVIIDSTLKYEQRDDIVRIRTASGKTKDITILQEGFKPTIRPKKSLVEIGDFDNVCHSVSFVNFNWFYLIPKSAMIQEWDSPKTLSFFLGKVVVLCKK